jgi:hypothetical protein
MPGRSRPSFSKRQKEQARKEKQRAKQARRMQRKLERAAPSREDDLNPADFASAEEPGPEPA